MPLLVLPLEASDTDAWARLFYPTFKESALGCLWRSAPSEESLQQLAQELRGILSTPGVHVFKCIDTDREDSLTGIAFWKVHDKVRSPEEVEAGFVTRDPFLEENREARLVFMKGLWDVQRLVMWTKPFICLESLMVHPARQREGVGNKLMKWGLEKSEELRIIAYLEASAKGKGLYERHGYKRAAEDVVFKATKYGSRVDDVHTPMIRRPESRKLNAGEASKRRT